MSFLFEQYDFSLFEGRFRDYKRQDQFSYRGLRTLFNYLDRLALDTGEPIEVDVIALCCEYTEIKKSEVVDELGVEHWSDLNEVTMLLEVDDDTIIYQAY